MSGITQALKSSIRGIEWKPNPGPQGLAYDSEADELLYGGGAGGGKSDLLLGIMLTRARNGAIFRAEKDQTDGLVERSIEIMGDATSYKIGARRWSLPGGRRLRFSGCRDQREATREQGRPKSHVGIDELTHFTENRYLFLTGWQRIAMGKKGEIYETQTICTCNPPTDSDGRWIIDRWRPWLSPKYEESTGRPKAIAGELRWFIRNKDGHDQEVDPAFSFEIEPGLVVFEDEGFGEVIHQLSKKPRLLLDDGRMVTGKAMPIVIDGRAFKPKSRTFIPALLSDNPQLMGTDYEAQVQALPEPLRSILLFGDWSNAGSDAEWQLYPAKWIELAHARWSPRKGTAKGQLDALGMDVARGSPEGHSVYAPLYGLDWFDLIVGIPGPQTKDGPEAAGFAVQIVQGTYGTVYCDVGGPGASAYDSLKAAEPTVGWRVVPVNNQDAVDRVGFGGIIDIVDVRALTHFLLYKALDPNGPNPIALPPCEELDKDLLAVRYKMTAAGMQLIPKDILRKKSGRGFNWSDAVANAMMRRASSIEVGDAAKLLRNKDADDDTPIGYRALG